MYSCLDLLFIYKSCYFSLFHQTVFYNRLHRAQLSSHMRVSQEYLYSVNAATLV